MFSVTKTEFVAIQGSSEQAAVTLFLQPCPQKERSHRKVLFQILAVDHHQQRRQDEAAAS
jgi:hypothetical protein